MKQQLESLEEIDIVNVITELEIYLKNDQPEDDVSDLPSNLIGKAESDRMREGTKERGAKRRAGNATITFVIHPPY